MKLQTIRIELSTSTEPIRQTEKLVADERSSQFEIFKYRLWRVIYILHSGRSKCIATVGKLRFQMFQRDSS